MATNGNESVERRSREVARDELDRSLQHYAKREDVTRELGDLEIRITEKLGNLETRIIKWAVGIGLAIVGISISAALLIHRLLGSSGS